MGEGLIARYSGGATGARRAAASGATVVIVDAYRASTTVAVLVSKGARVIPVASLDEAAMVEADFRVGERGSAKLAGFDFGNSPTDLQNAEVPTGSTVALTTTNGTRVVEAASGAPAILTGAFVNAHALARELSEQENGSEIMVVGCCWEGRRASEDEVASGAILHHLQKFGAKLDERAERVANLYLRHAKQSLKNNSAARRLKRLGYERDLDFCLSEDILPVVPRLEDGTFVEGRK
ncbi:MAG: 2-phosphosulfolactate phosphatase [Actinomycetota bacterium]|nr:2-phosphosulfolactate phosphatase [Actinomycetota bacterium]